MPTPAPSFQTIDLLLQASPIVKGVILILLIFSVISWAIILHKQSLFKLIQKRASQFDQLFWSGKSLDTIYSESKQIPSSPLSEVFKESYLELQRIITKYKGEKITNSLYLHEAVLANLERSLKKASITELAKLESFLSFLATCGSTSPFIGLFGTVWGIVHAFKEIGTHASASLAVVAPGIAEALIATAIGLIAAIPAVIAYNHFMQKIKKTEQLLETFSFDFLNIVKRNFLPTTT